MNRVQDILITEVVSIMRKIPDTFITFSNPAEWRAWLEAHHDSEQEAWLVISRKGAPRQFLELAEAVEEALCYGWIDGALKPINQESYALRFSPRKPGSIWSIHNRRRVEHLIQAGRMTPAGMEKVADAIQSGEWDAAIDREDVSSVPDDLVQALEENDAWIGFDDWPASQKKQYLYWLESAKRPETREKRIQAIVDLATSERYGHPRR